MSSAPTSAPKINTSTLPQHLPAPTSSTNAAAGKPLSPSNHKVITSALLQANSIPRIEAALSQSLSEVGWTSNLRTYITTLVRSGECSSYEEVVSKVLEAVRRSISGGTLPDGNSVKIPKEALVETAKVVKQEVEKVLDVRVDDIDD
jgi:transcription factor e(y)2